MGYPKADPISSHRINVLTFLHSAYMDKGTGQQNALLQPQRANGGVLPAPVPLPAVWCGTTSCRRKLGFADLAEYLPSIVKLLFLCQCVDQGQQFLADHDQRLHFLQRIDRTGLEVMV